ncbi:MAG: PQQ-binding-like beta-propeller repeat protein [Bacteroidota bacterium]|nr:PQQ-binding-like beta-propeller repeat protein [Bacteroidota bacterium]
MRKIIFSVIIFFVFTRCSSQSSTPKMFRDNITHQTYSHTSYDQVYDTKAWQFDAGAPVRSTPLIDNKTVYFGTAGGTFFAIDKKTAAIKWQYHTAKAIHSSAACQEGKIYFSDNGQTLYCLNELSGQLNWKMKLGEKLSYPWRFDYYYSSPVLYQNKLYIGSDDGYLYAVNAKDGKIVWKFKTTGLVRSTAAISNDMIFIGDSEGVFYCLDMKGKVKWTFKVVGQPVDPVPFGFDRKAILAAPVITQGKIIFGARDGYLYCLDANDGKQLWTVNHVISWIISTVAVKDTFVITGTSDKAFVQAVSLNTGKEIWKFQGTQAIWSSPLINNDKIYEGCFDGQLFCLDLKTGKRISQFATNGIILSSPVLDDSLLYIGSDDGHLYALKGHLPVQKVTKESYVYYDAKKVNAYFHNGADVRIRNYLRNNGFKVINTDTLLNVLSAASPAGKTIVYATDIFTKATIRDGKSSLIRQFLDHGGRIILLGNNPLFYETDEAGQEITALADRRIDSVLSLDYGPTDTRAFGGLFPGFVNEKGKYCGLPERWVSTFGIDKRKVDIVLGENENGEASAYVKKYSNGGELVQVYMHAEIPVNLDAIIKLAEWKLD